MLTLRIRSQFQRTPFFNSHDEDWLLNAFVLVATEFNVFLNFDTDLKQILYMAGSANKRREDRKAAQQMANAKVR